MRILVFLIAFCIGTFCKGQQDSVYNNNLLITYSPSALLNIFPGIQFGIEKFIANDITLELEVARLIPISTERNFRANGLSRFEMKSGYRVKLGFKKFIKSRLLILGTIYYRNTDHNFEEWVFREQGRFEELINYNSTKRLIGPTVGFGFTNKIKNSFYYETAVNIGLGSYKVTQTGVPEDVIMEDEIFTTYRNPGDYLFPIIGLSFKIKYGL